MELTEEQQGNLVQAIREYKKAANKLEAANSELSEKLTKLKMCAQSNGNGDVVLQDAMVLLGQAFLKEQE